jgi:outer membrane protein assembly factor BamB
VWYYSKASELTEEFLTSRKQRTYAGSWSGPIVANGLVYVASWRLTGEPATVEGHRIRVDAEDLVVAMDALTGKTVWLTAEPGGMMAGGGKRMGIAVSPVHHRGVVYRLGSTLRIFAHDALTGKVKWISDAHPRRAERKALRERILAELAAGRFKYDKDPNYAASLVVAGETLVVPDGKGGLAGVDLAQGGKRWFVAEACSPWATPAVWRHDGREYLLAANNAGILRMLNPEDGSERWRLTGLGTTHFTLAPGRTHVLVNVAPDSGQNKGAGGVTRIPGRLGAVRLTPTGGQRTWDAPEDHRIAVWLDNLARMRVLYQEGRFLLGTCYEERTPAYILDEESGRVVSRLAPPPENDKERTLRDLFYWCGDRIISRANSSHNRGHGGRHPICHWTTGPDGGLTLGAGAIDLADYAHGYEVIMEAPLVGGLMFERTEDGSVVCYDLRARR